MPTFEMDGRHIYYESYGQGTPLVLLNGIMMSCASWQPFIETLSANNRLLLVDFLDQGKSDKMTGQIYDHGIQVQVVRRLLEHLSLASACVAGISYGSEVALEFSVTYPEMTDRLVLLNATAATGWWLGDIGRAWNLVRRITILPSPLSILPIFIPGVTSGWKIEKRCWYRSLKTATSLKPCAA